MDYRNPDSGIRNLYKRYPLLTMFSVGYVIAFSILMQGINRIILAVNLGKIK